jgi:hypothetical protein
MPDSESIEARLERLLQQSAALRETSAELARDAERLKAEIEKARGPEGRQKPRVKGK